MFRIVCDPSSGSIELYLTEIHSGSLMFVVCLVVVWQRNFEPVVCVCVLYDGLRTSSQPITETYRSNFNTNLHPLFVHMLVHNKDLLFNMHGINIKVILKTFLT